MGEHWNRVMGSDPELFERFRLAEDPGDVATDALLDAIPLHNKSVLEVGCGTGALTSLLVGRAQRVIGIDRASAAIHRVDSRATNLTLCVGDALSPPLHPQAVDQVIGGWMLAYVPSTHLRACLVGLARCLRPGPTNGLWAIENHWESEIQLMRGRGGRAQDSEVQGLLDEGFEVVAERETSLEFEDVAAARKILGGLIGERALADLDRRPRARLAHRLVLLHCPQDVLP